MKRALGIEGGGTKTEWHYLDDSGGPARSGILPPANLRLISDPALERIFRVLPSDPTHAGVFLAGCATEEDRRRLAACVARVWPQAKVVVGSDRESGFAAAFGANDGVAVIAGTGSAITGRRDGRVEKAGGWGQLLGDIGSGYHLAVQALRHVLWTYDLTRRVTRPGESLLSALALNRLEDLVRWAEEADKLSVAQLAPVVFQAAEEGDAEMAVILDRGAEALADGACALIRRLGFEMPPEIKLQGGLFIHHRDYAQRCARRIAETWPKARVSVCTESGAAGSLWLAARELAATQPVEPEIDLTELAGALTEQPNPRSQGLDAMSAPEIVDLFLAEEACVGDALNGARTSLITAVELTADALRNGGRLFYVGAGTSGRLGVLDASEIPPTFGASPELVQAVMAGGSAALYRAAEGAEDQMEAGALAMEERGVRPGDTVCGITASGRTPFVLGALHRAREIGAHTLLLSCNPARSRNSAPWEVEIDLATGPELLAGSTRLKAGTATKCALNILSTAVMVRLGKVRGNLMAGVIVTNAKLRDRAIRLVAALRGLCRPEAEALLEANGWDVRRCLPPG
ncbi:MAG: N-acetylmuramic acid 6-phosphate etherase [Verrucomicrobiota bacterium]